MPELHPQDLKTQETPSLATQEMDILAIHQVHLDPLVIPLTVVTITILLLQEVPQVELLLTIQV